ncbi:hypothetical protein QVD99_001009 [Batrachochytrium dendrobatidis]|nr:hypothetical protein QVD99_001009 [Batrachochytrium dendrobatidis]
MKSNDFPHQIIHVHSGMQLCIDIININHNPSQTSQTSVASLHSFENTRYQAKVACEMVICTRLNNIDIYNQCDVGTELLFPNLKVQIVHIVIKSNPHPSCHTMSCLIVSYTAARVVLCVFRVFPSLHHTVLAQTT